MLVAGIQALLDWDGDSTMPSFVVGGGISDVFPTMTTFLCITVLVPTSKSISMMFYLFNILRDGKFCHSLHCALPRTHAFPSASPSPIFIFSLLRTNKTGLSPLSLSLLLVLLHLLCWPVHAAFCHRYHYRHLLVIPSVDCILGILIGAVAFGWHLIPTSPLPSQ